MIAQCMEAKPTSTRPDECRPEERSGEGIFLPNTDLYERIRNYQKGIGYRLSQESKKRRNYEDGNMQLPEIMGGRKEVN